MVRVLIEVAPGVEVEQGGRVVDRRLDGAQEERCCHGEDHQPDDRALEEGELAGEQELHPHKGDQADGQGKVFYEIKVAKSHPDNLEDLEKETTLATS